MEFAKISNGKISVGLPPALIGHSLATLRTLGWKPLERVQHTFDPETQYFPAAPVYTEEVDRIVEDHVPVAMPEEVRAGRELSLVNTRKPALKKAAEDAMSEQLRRGFDYDFGTIPAKAPDGDLVEAGVQRFQLRDVEDRLNWQTALSTAEKLKAAGMTAAIIELRMESNLRVQCSPDEAITALSALLTWGSNLLTATWDKKDAIESAATMAALELVA